ncbi:MAG: bifunctional (p)ppGpp synthetase/guanosine-3',5'-bis(diphosphate) 3'-pyrophosphohydrolase [Pseudomonadota bacterium]
MIRQYELVDRVKSYDPKTDEGTLNKAYVYAMKAHGAQKRASGDPYYSHPLEVAGILSEYRLDNASIITALLHDTVEDTEATLEDIERMFGKEIATLVDGVTKLTRIELQSTETSQAENFRKLVLAMSADLRVLLVKLADRLHNMRTLHFVGNEEKRKRIARETMEIYAPLAERIGMRDFQEELLDLSFRELNPDARESIIKRLHFLKERGDDIVPKIIKELDKTLRKGGLKAEISGREKAPYSIWRKMQHDHVEFEQLSDIMAFRVVLETVDECYQALGILHGKYSIVPGRFKDYISLAKPNGYSSLHTGVIGPQQQRIEVQIRTREMHDVAEYGVAAHWKYKVGWSARKSRTDGTQYRWLRELLEILEHASGPEEFLEHTKLEMFQDQVFCFTPGGDLIALPRGATPVDFAYAVHSEIGDTCVGAKVNGRMTQLRTKLRNGDQVEIITSKAQTPSPEWERLVVTGKARARIRRFIRSQERSQYVDLGRAILEKAFRQEGYPLTVKALQGVVKTLKRDSVEDIYVAVGEGLMTGREVVGAVYPEIKEKAAAKRTRAAAGAKSKTRPKARRKNGKAAGDTAVDIRGLMPGLAVHLAGCCHPLPGDRIVGIVTTGKGVTIHTIDCETLESFSDMPERWLDVSWDLEANHDTPHVGRISVLVANEPGSLGNLSTVIGKNEGNISNLKITNRSQDFFEMLIDIQVRDAKHLTNIMAALRATPVINSVKRTHG